MAADTQLMKGILEGCILSVISKQTSYGYKVIEELKAIGFEDVAEATVYPILNRLEKKGDLKSEKKPSAMGPPRKYYSLTGQGTEALKIFTQSWEKTSSIVSSLLKEG